MRALPRRGDGWVRGAGDFGHLVGKNKGVIYHAFHGSVDFFSSWVRFGVTLDLLMVTPHYSAPFGNIYIWSQPKPSMFGHSPGCVFFGAHKYGGEMRGGY